MRLFYTFIIYFLSPFVLIRLYFLGIKNPAYRERWQERFGFFTRTLPDKPIVWLHAVSVGEVNAARPIVTQLLNNHSDYQVLITTVTPTGASTVEQHFENDVLHCYLPYDLPFSIKRFLEKVKPSLLITMETEIWPNLYQSCHALKIPVLIVNARLSQRSAKGYRFVSALMRQTLSLVDMIAAQTNQDADRFLSFGAMKEKVCVTGNLKFDVAVPVSVTERAESLKRYFSVNRPIWIAASTQEGEEEIVLNAHKHVLKECPDAILVLAPRHPERVKKVAALCSSTSLDYIKRTDQTPFSNDCSVYLVDTLGELQLHYAASQIAFVGGSLVNKGGQNMMEPASLGLPIISGPCTYNFTEITELLIGEGALISVSNAAELATEVIELMNDANKRHYLGEKAQKLIEANKGNIDGLMKLISPYLSH